MKIQQDSLPSPLLPPLSSPFPPPSPSLSPQLSLSYNQMKKMDNSKQTHTTMNTKAPSCANADDGHVSPNQNFRQHGQQQLKKQVRRRLTNRPYHERLMNMADARKEIATALKYHRATTKLAIEHQEQLQRHPQQHHSLSFQLPFYSRFSLDGRFKARRRPQMYPPPSNKISQYLNDLSFSSSFPPLPSLPLHSPPLHLPF
ncbi:hypothetical protein V8G54_035877, partial [Vigna mungo]